MAFILSGVSCAGFPRHPVRSAVWGRKTTYHPLCSAAVGPARGVEPDQLTADPTEHIPQAHNEARYFAAASSGATTVGIGTAI